MIVEDSLDGPLRDALARMQDRIMKRTLYHGIKTRKNPLDFWAYQEIIYERRPDFIVEIGNYYGGSTVALADVLDRMGHGLVIAVDIARDRFSEAARTHPRIHAVTGDAAHAETVSRVKGAIHDDAEVLIIEDSAHTYDNTLSVLEGYSELVRPGGYFIVEDTICGHGLDVGPRPGAYEAVADFVDAHDEFVADRSRDFFITWNPGGFLKRI